MMPRSARTGSMLVILLLAGTDIVRAAPPDGLRPKHVTDATLVTVDKGLQYLARMQSPNGSWQTMSDGRVYPVTMTALAGMAFLANGNTTSRGPYAETVEKTTRYLIDQQNSTGLISRAEENGRPMYGHGFSMLFLSTVYGMETDPRARLRIKEVVTNAIKLTAQGQSVQGGWTYTPGSGDEGSVTVTQMQALRAANSAGFTVPKATIANAVRYLERCKTAEGGIRYSINSGGDTRLPISAAAITCLYSAGEYESPLAKDCLKYVFGQFQKQTKAEFGNEWGHGFYLHLYASQSFYQAGDTYWDAYFPPVRDYLIKSQSQDGHWDGNEVGPAFGTSVALIILQLPYKFLPIYQR